MDIVCDASVALSWFHAEDEEEVQAAQGLLDLHRRRVVALSVLDLTPYEIGNALLRGRPGFSAEQVLAVLQALDVICPRITLAMPAFADATTLAADNRLTLYDAAYAAATRARHCELATLDRELLRAGLGRRPSQILADLT